MLLPTFHKFVLLLPGINLVEKEAIFHSLGLSCLNYLCYLSLAAAVLIANTCISLAAGVNENELRYHTILCWCSV